MRGPYRTRLLPLVLAVLAVVGACADRDGGEAAAEGAITVGSFNFSESALLAEIYAQALEAEGFPVERRLDLAAREIVEPALEQGLVDLVPEYLGSALAFLDEGKGGVTADAEAVHANLATAFADRGVEVLAYAEAENPNGIVVTRERAQELGLRTISDLVPVAPQLVFGGPPECPQRPFCLAGLEETYGLEFQAFEPLDSGGRLTLAALRAGDIDLALLFTTDGNLVGDELVLLEDDRRLQPAENVVPVLRADVVERYGQAVVDPIDSVSSRITTAQLTQLNREVSEAGRPAEVAADWLKSAGLG